MSAREVSAPPAGDDTALNPTSPVATGARRAEWIVGLCAGLIAGAGLWVLVQLIHPVFWTTQGMDQWGFLPLDVQWALDRNNAMLILALLGGVTAGGLAVGHAINYGAGRRALRLLCAWTAIGFVAGGIAGYWGHRTFELLRHQHEIEELKRAFCTYGVMFSITGGGIGLGAGILVGRSLSAAVQSLVAGGVAGAMAAAVYGVSIAILVPDALTSVLLPTEPIDWLLWLVLFSGSLGLIVPLMTPRQGASRSSAPASS